MGRTIEKIEAMIIDGMKYEQLKEQYEARLKTDMIAMLEKLKTEIEEKATELCDDGWWLTYNNLIQEKIDKLKENTDE